MRYTGPLLLLGLYVMGWLKLWSRPDYTFALIYAAGVGLSIMFAGLFAPFQPGYEWSTPELYFSIGYFQLWGLIGALGFLLPALAVVALRRRVGGAGENQDT